MDQQQFIERMEQCERLLYRIAWTMLPSAQDVEDAMQDTALTAWAKRDTLRDPASFRSWAARIMVNRCNDTLRRQKRMLVTSEVPSAPVSDASPDTAFALALSSLPEKYRLPLLLCYGEGMNDHEIAAVLRIPASTVRGRLYRAKKQLRKELTEA